MEKIVINGGKKLSGTVPISGSKNAALPVIAATILGESPSVIHNVPDLVDIKNLCSILKRLGAKITQDGPNTLVVDPKRLTKYKASYDLVRRMRASICVLGPLLGRLGKAEVSMPGGCVIGSRPIDLHLKGLKALGAKLNIHQGYIIANASRLLGNDIYLAGRFGSSVLATANVVMAAVKAKGITVIENAACEPELVDLVNLLVKMGAEIKGAGSHTITIKGVEKLQGAEYTIIPDRIEAGTYMIAGAITKGDISLLGARMDHMHALVDKLREAGVKVENQGHKIRVRVLGRLKTTDITTLQYPGFPTDMQAQFMTLMTLVRGLSIITEKIFPERFMHIPELLRMAADISLESATAVIRGVRRLSGAPVMASDLRASAALILAGLAAEGTTEVNRIYHLDRGYEKMTEKLSALGADIKRI